MIIFPAVDIKGGKCVRLHKGRADRETVFMDDPVEAALHWQEQGAQWLHIIDLDGAFSGEPVNIELIRRLCASVSIPIQMGGGIRTAQTAELYLKAGITRLIIGTMAIDEPEKYTELASAFPGQIGVSLDTEDGEVRTKGWVAGTGLKITDVLPRLAEQQTAFVIHTDISRDGTQSGVNLETLASLAQSSPLPLIAAGGVATLADIKNLYPLTKTGNLEGAITGQAIYDGTLSLKEAMNWIGDQG